MVRNMSGYPTNWELSVAKQKLPPKSTHLALMLDSQIMRHFVFGTICFFIIWPIAAFSCECGPPGHASRYVKEASIIFVGRVLFTDDDGSGKFIQKTLVHFEVEEAFKGLGAEIHDVWVDPGSFTSCYARYCVGERFLVFAYGGTLLLKDTSAVSVVPGKTGTKPFPPGIDPKNPPKVYSAPECSGTRLITSDTKDAVSREVDYLRRYKEKVARETKHP